jgi:hypothetical protein
MNYRAVCDRCGYDRWNYDLRAESGLRVCRNGCYDPPHPQEKVRGRADRQTPPWVKPEPDGVFLFEYLLRESGTPYLREAGGGIVRE